MKPAAEWAAALNERMYEEGGVTPEDVERIQRDALGLADAREVRIAPPALEIVGDEPRTLRDYFAAHALQALIGLLPRELWAAEPHESADMCCGCAWEIADRMLNHPARAKARDGAR